MAGRLRLKFSHRFPGVIWKTVLLHEKSILFLEVRNRDLKTVSFAAFNYVDNTFLWRDVQLEEKWWVNLSAATAERLLFTIYLDTTNPDKKGLLVYELSSMRLAWWNNNFAINRVSGDVVSGMLYNMGKETFLDVDNGQTRHEAVGAEAIACAPDPTIRPVQYLDDSSHFESVKTFLSQKLNLSPVLAFEYLEYDGHIFVSYYVTETGLANYLLIINDEGEVLLHEKLAEHLKGIGMETFFVLAGCVFFVKNREDLVSYFL